MIKHTFKVLEFSNFKIFDQIDVLKMLGQGKIIKGSVCFELMNFRVLASTQIHCYMLLGDISGDKL